MVAAENSKERTVDKMSQKNKKAYYAELESKLPERYTIDGEIGKGGFATVFNARDQIIDRQIAIKVLELEQYDEGSEELERALKRFLREARVAARVSHPSVIDIYDFGLLEGEDVPYIVMEFLEGYNLYRQLQNEGPIPPSWLLPNYCDILDALGEVHVHNIVHKDLKPGNIFLNKPQTRREVWKIVDFGIAHVDSPEGGARLTKTGFLSGTPQYLPPEYIQEQKVSPQMDVYQMALTLVEALCGEPVVGERKPFKAAMMHVEGKLDIDESLWASPLGPVLEKALATDANDRYATGLEFADALAAVDVHAVPSFAREEERSRQRTAKWAAIEGPKG